MDIIVNSEGERAVLHSWCKASGKEAVLNLFKESRGEIGLDEDPEVVYVVYYGSIYIVEVDRKQFHDESGTWMRFAFSLSRGDGMCKLVAKFGTSDPAKPAAEIESLKCNGGGTRVVELACRILQRKGITEIELTDTSKDPTTLMTTAFRFGMRCPQDVRHRHNGEPPESIYRVMGDRLQRAGVVVETVPSQGIVDWQRRFKTEIYDELTKEERAAMCGTLNDTCAWDKTTLAAAGFQRVKAEQQRRGVSREQFERFVKLPPAMWTYRLAPLAESQRFRNECIADDDEALADAMQGMTA